MPLNLGFGFGSSKSKSTTSIDSMLRGLQEANYTGAQGLPSTYAPTSQDQIQGYLNPYTDEVIDRSMADQERFRQMAVNNTSDAASAASAFGGARHGVAEGITNEGAIAQAGLLAAQLRERGYGQALETAQGENRFGFQYPLARQGILDQSLAGITPTVTQKGKQSQWGVTGGWSGGGGGGSGGGGDIAALMGLF